MTSTLLPSTVDGESVSASRKPGEMLFPGILIVIASVVLFWAPTRNLFQQWWTNPDAGQGLLLFPLSIWLAWRAGLTRTVDPARWWGAAFLVTAILFRALGALAAELFTQRLAIWLAAVGVILFYRGWQQVREWWLPLSLTFLSIPLPDLVLNRLSNPLQMVASAWGTALIEWRHVPVDRTGNVLAITSPETGEVIRLFVAEACSGLRSLTALFALGLAVGGMYLRSAWSRVFLILLTVPVALALNAVRVFLTAYLMYHVSLAFGNGFMHESQGWGLFAVAFMILGTIAAGLTTIERAVRRRRAPND